MFINRKADFFWSKKHSFSENCVYRLEKLCFLIWKTMFFRNSAFHLINWVFAINCVFQVKNGVFRSKNTVYRRKTVFCDLLHIWLAIPVHPQFELHVWLCHYMVLYRFWDLPSVNYNVKLSSKGLIIVHKWWKTLLLFAQQDLPSDLIYESN